MLFIPFMEFKSRLSIGTVQFGVHYGISNKNGQTTPEEVTKILNLALDQGIYSLDTATVYGNAEKVLGENNLEGFRIVSKFMPPSKEETIINQLYKSLEKLQVTTLYGFLAHRPLNVYENPWQWEELKELKSSGLIEKIGFSLNEPSELDTLLNKGFSPDLIQVPFNYFDHRFAKHLIDIKEKGCEVHVRSALLQGLFFADMNILSSFFDEVKPLIRSLQESITFLSGSLLRFVIEQPFIDKVVIGVENCSQLVMNLETIEKSSKLPELTKTISENILIPSKWPQ